MPGVVHCFKCPLTEEYADLPELHKMLETIEAECVLAGNRPCWLASAVREGLLSDSVDPRGPKGK